jgi:plasmid stabilization system protein ParE
MARKVKWTEAAWSDLEEAADYIARDSPHYAAAFVHGARNLHALWEREGQSPRGDIE